MIFTRLALSQTKRLLSLQDSRPFSPTRGCFDKRFWHFKTSDFSNSAAQMACEHLAVTYANRLFENPYYKNPFVLNSLEYGLIYLCKIQNKDGSFDEWYPSEKGWAGPTGYLVHTINLCLSYVEDDLSPQLVSDLKVCVKNACHHLSRRDEGDVLSNHVAVTMLAFYESYHLTGDEWFLQQYSRWKKVFTQFISNEGWAVEYDGFDAGYAMATLSFFAHIHRLCHDQELFDFAKKSLKMLQYCFYPNGSFGGAVGSRGTNHIYPFAISYWSQFHNEALPILNFINNDTTVDNLVPPGQQDDSYLYYRLSDFVLADFFYPADKYENEPLPFQRKQSFSNFFSEAGIFIKKTSSYYFIANLKRGGVGYCFSLDEPYKTLNFSSLAGKTKNGTIFTNQTCLEPWRVVVKDSTLEVKGYCHKVRYRNFTPLKLIIFRISCLLTSRSTSMSYFLKRIIRKMLITSSSRSNVLLRRQFFLSENRIKIIDRVNGPVDEIKFGMESNFRYVPQSSYTSSIGSHYETKKFAPDQKKKIISSWSPQ